MPADTDEKRLHAAACAAMCCQEIHIKLTNFPTPVPGCSFSFHIGLGYGEVTLMQLGGVCGRYECSKTERKN
jgi:hypothetical protein